MLLASAAFALFRARRAWHDLRGLAGIAGDGLGQLAERATAAADRLSTAGERPAATVAVAVAELRASLARAGVLARNLREARATLARARGWAPTK